MREDDEYTSFLEDIGLTESEAKVYLAMLEKGSQTAGKLATASKTSSSKIYEVLEKLSNKGLCSYILEDKIKIFTAANPEAIKEYITEKTVAVQKQQKTAEKLIPHLQQQMLTQKQVSANIYKGYKGLEVVFKEAISQLNTKDEFLAFGTPPRSERANRFFTKLAQELAERKIKVRSVFTQEARGELQTTVKGKYLDVRYTDQFAAAATNIIKDRVIIFPKEIGEPILFVLDNVQVAETYRVQFEELWKKARH